MGRTINIDAATDDKVRDARVTLANATSLGAPWDADAEQFLGPGLERDKAYRAERQANAEAVDLARSEQGMQNHRCDKLVGEQSDLLFNLFGRRLRDRTLGEVLPEGVAGFTNVRPGNKHHALLGFAARLEAVDHPKLTEEVVAELTTELREAAAVMAEINARFGPLRDEQRAIGKKMYTNARNLQIQLQRLKKQWAAGGATEQEIHLLIPHRPKSTGETPPTATAPAAPTPVPEPTPEPAPAVSVTKPTIS